ncbi:Bifunctional (p)ppGpp synthase/hydrolase relA [Corynebacterium gerontici]|uniref:Bifunctional (P)ppGpp synthase/hydrolase relA n=2 Tax=Corynebacterium gerontici TaxID=2079234 RepID=A0A3G6IZT9_9CORY|nr:Bifunctional (p)ppGpp synthase/hydrolase relA [Corynebacterium gerontici]
MRKGTLTPYVSHLFAVATLLENEPENTRIAALLHDAIEDRDVAPSEIEKEFGTEVRELVQAVTKSNHPDWWTRAEDYLERMGSAPPEALKIIAADKVHNLWCTLQEEDPWERFSTGYQGQCWWYQEVLKRLRIEHPLVEELSQLVAELLRRGH